MPKSISGKQTIKLLVRYYNFDIVSQKGSHVKLSKQTIEGKVSTVVPIHKELAFGTLRGVLRLAKIEYKDFEKYIK